MTPKEWLLGDDVIEIVSWPPYQRAYIPQPALPLAGSKTPVAEQPAEAKTGRPEDST